MCGITGIYSFNGSDTLSLDTLKRMTAVMQYRGPDEAGIYIDSFVGLGHARLSIIDLCSGTQPIHNEDKTMWIIYNGEVYNYPELREKLVQKGHTFYTTSDTEVILHLYEEKGPACLDDLNGQFALAIWDSKKRELFLARDRIGIRPLYYTRYKDTLIFASEVKSIFMVDEIPRQIDPVAMDQIFTFWTTLPGVSIFKDICELPPGHYLRAAHGKVSINKYWDIPFYPRHEQVDLSPAEISEKIHELLLDAVRIRLRADVPVGAYLSGGLDSSGVTSLVVQNFNSDVRTFGIRFEEDAFDEGKYQNRMVFFLKANHKEIMATNDEIGESLNNVIWHCEKPLLRTAPVPLFLLSKLVRQSGIKVVLTGEGADEIFGGYNIFRETKVRRFWARQPDSTMRPGLIGQLYPYIFDNPRLKRMLESFFGMGLDQFDDPLFSHLVRWENTGKIKTFFSDELKAAIGSYDGYEQVKESLPDGYAGWDTLSRAQYLETSLFLSNYLLSSQGDRVAMANSIEIRLPYLDPRLMEFMGRVPSKWKILGLNEKHILKKSFQGILPDDIVNRAKHPYRAPIEQSLFSGKALESVHDMLSETSLSNAGLFDPAKVNRLKNKLINGGEASETDNMALVGILSSQMVARDYIDDFSSRTENVIDKLPRTVIFDRKNKTDYVGVKNAD
ncbi:MAG: asparagine synthase (glutamine-hydrolyzing) [Sedimentisphaerales bacterium]|nr:asparagine synthase (glutamine-hydrolyzing) [Sedimentisphaerales bacterium]